MDLFKNPMVDNARYAMTPEQQEDYKKIGQYMYSKEYQTINEKLDEAKSIKEPTIEEIAIYASEGLKAGLSPMDLSEKEIKALTCIYGEKWYQKFDISEEVLSKNVIEAFSSLPRYQRRNAKKLSNKIAKKEAKKNGRKR